MMNAAMMNDELKTNCLSFIIPHSSFRISSRALYVPIKKTTVAVMIRFKSAIGNKNFQPKFIN
jgi:hypothetical protein